MTACPRCGTENIDSARFCNSCGNAIAVGPAPAEVLKTVTVMFMDVAGSTALGERTHPESLRRVMTRYFDEIRSIVEGHGGTVEKYIGDAVMAVFGVPVVHEDDALRAVRAASDVRARLEGVSAELERERGMTVAWRTGLNTGEVVAGDAGAGQRFVTGDAVNVAARLEQAAQPGEILIGADTLQLVRDSVTAAPVAAIVAKGKSAPLTAFRLQEVGRGPAPAVRPESPLVGRRRQLRLLADAYGQVVDDRTCHLFTVLGTAGVGKTRLVAEFTASLPAEALVLHGHCLSYGEGITYRPIAEAIRGAAGLSEQDDDDVLRARIGAVLDDDTERALVVERVGMLLGRFTGPSAAEEIAWASRRLLESLARRRPVVLVIEDVHWAEPNLLDLVEHVAEWTHDAQLLLICVARLELLEARPGWGGGKANATTLTLEPLSESESRDLTANLLGRAEVGAEVVERIAAVAEGNPLFVEHVLGMLIDDGSLVRSDGRWTATADLGDAVLPPTIQAVLAARLDRLPAPERAVIERGAVEGRVFHRSAVAELAPAELRPEVPLHLRALSRKELVRPDRSDFAGDEAYRFRHLLLRDAAYAAMPKEERAELHARFAAWLERISGERVREYQDILGYHLAQAYRYRAELGPLDAQARSLGERAAGYLTVAGQRAVQLGDARAATKLLGAALELTPLDRHGRYRLAAEFGMALMTTGEMHRADEMLDAEVARARAADDELGAGYAEIIGLINKVVLGQISPTRVVERSQELLSLFDRHGDRWGWIWACSTLGESQFFAGRGRLAAEVLGTGVERYPADELTPMLIGALHVALYWGSGSVTETERLLASIATGSSRVLEALVLRMRGGLRSMVGDFDGGRTLLLRSIGIERELGRQIAADGTTGHFLGVLEHLAGNRAEAEAMLRQAFDAMTARGDRGYSSSVAGNLAALYIEEGRIDEAEIYSRIALETAQLDDAEAQAQGNSALARVQAVRGDNNAAQASIARAVAVAEATDFMMRRGWVQADLAEVLLAAGKPGEARAAEERAIALFEAKGATWVAGKARRRLAEMDAETAGGVQE